MFVAEYREKGGRDEGPDEHAEAEGAAEQRQRAGTERQRHARRHERVPREPEDGRAEADDEDGCREHCEVRRESEPRDTRHRDAAADRHRHPFADAGDGPAGGDVAAELPDDEGGGDECGGRDVGAEARGEDRQKRDDGAFAEREENGRPVDHGRETPEHAPHRGGGVGFRHGIHVSLECHA